MTQLNVSVALVTAHVRATSQEHAASDGASVSLQPQEHVQGRAAR